MKRTSAAVGLMKKSQTAPTVAAVPGRPRRVVRGLGRAFLYLSIYLSMADFCKGGAASATNGQAPAARSVHSVVT